MAATQVDAEWHALVCGAKPALRISGSLDTVAAIAERYESRGFIALVARGTVGGAAGAVVYVGRSLGEAEAARDAEAPLLTCTERPSPADELAGVRRLGAALGYPPCCVEGFCARINVSVHGRFRRDYRAARAAWVTRPRWPLNHLVRASDWTVVPFEPCRYDCPVALAYAERVLAAIGTADPNGRARLEAHLRRAVAVSIHGARAYASLGAGGVVVSAEAPRSPDGRAGALDERYARELVGAIVAPGGTIRVGRRRAVLVDFRERAGPDGPSEEAWAPRRRPSR